MKALPMLAMALALAGGCGHHTDQRDSAHKRIAAAYHACAHKGLTGALNLGDHEQTISGLNLDLSYVDGDKNSLSQDLRALDCVLGQLHASRALTTDMVGINQTGSKVENGVRYEWKLQKGTAGSTMTFVATTLD